MFKTKTSVENLRVLHQMLTYIHNWEKTVGTNSQTIPPETPDTIIGTKPKMWQKRLWNQLKNNMWCRVNDNPNMNTIIEMHRNLKTPNCSKSSRQAATS